MRISFLFIRSAVCFSRLCVACFGVAFLSIHKSMSCSQKTTTLFKTVNGFGKEGSVFIKRLMVLSDKESLSCNWLILIQRKSLRSMLLMIFDILLCLREHPKFNLTTTPACPSIRDLEGLRKVVALHDRQSFASRAS